MVKINTELRIAMALESIEKSLSALVEDIKAKKELNEKINKRLEDFETVLMGLRDDPLGLNKRN